MTTWTTDGDPWLTDGDPWTTGEADFDPANLSATVVGDTVSLSWDASPLVPA